MLHFGSLGFALSSKLYLADELLLRRTDSVLAAVG